MSQPCIGLDAVKAFLRQPTPREVPPEVLAAACRGRKYRTRALMCLLGNGVVGVGIGIVLTHFFPDWHVLAWIAAGVLVADGVDDFFNLRRRRRTILNLLENGRPATARLEELARPGFFERLQDQISETSQDTRQMRVTVRHYDDAHAERSAVVIPLAARDDIDRLKNWAANPDTVVHILHLPDVPQVLLADLWVEA